MNVRCQCFAFSQETIFFYCRISSCSRYDGVSVLANCETADDHVVACGVSDVTN